MTTKTKVCKTCSTEKSRNSFYKYSKVGKNGKRYLFAHCMSCHKANTKLHYIVRKEKRMAFLEERKNMPKEPTLKELKIGELKSGPWFECYMARIEANLV